MNRSACPCRRAGSGGGGNAGIYISFPSCSLCSLLVTALPVNCRVCNLINCFILLISLLYTSSMFLYSKQTKTQMVGIPLNTMHLKYENTGRTYVIASIEYVLKSSRRDIATYLTEHESCSLCLFQN